MTLKRYSLVMLYLFLDGDFMYSYFNGHPVANLVDLTTLNLIGDHCLMFYYFMTGSAGTFQVT